MNVVEEKDLQLLSIRRASDLHETVKQCEQGRLLLLDVFRLGGNHRSILQQLINTYLGVVTHLVQLRTNKVHKSPRDVVLGQLGQKRRCQQLRPTYNQLFVQRVAMTKKSPHSAIWRVSPFWQLGKKLQKVRQEKSRPGVG